MVSTWRARLSFHSSLIHLFFFPSLIGFSGISCTRRWATNLVLLPLSITNSICLSRTKQLAQNSVIHWCTFCCHRQFLKLMDLGRLSRILTITIEDAIILTLGSSSDLFGANKLLWINVSGLSLTTSSLGSSSLESTSSPPSYLSSLSCSYVSPFPFEVASRALCHLWHSDRNVANLVALEAMNVLLPDRLIVPSV